MAKLGKQCWQSTLHSLPGLALLSGENNDQSGYTVGYSKMYVTLSQELVHNADQHFIIFMCFCIIATVLTVLALVVSLSVAAIDDRISLYPDQPSLWYTTCVHVYMYGSCVCINIHVVPFIIGGDWDHVVSKYIVDYCVCVRFSPCCTRLAVCC